MQIGQGVIIGSGAVLGTAPGPAGNIVLSYEIGNSVSFNGQGFDLSYGNFVGPDSGTSGANLIFDNSSDYANGAYGNIGVYTAESGNTNVTAGNIFVNHGPLSYLTFDGGANGQYVDSTFVGGTNIPSGSSYTYFAVVRVNNFGTSGTPTGAIVAGNTTFFGFLPPNTLGPDNYPLLVAGIGAPQCADVVTQFQPNTWYAVAVTYDSTSQTMKIYTNGVLVTGLGNPATGIAPFSGNEPLYWGTWQGGNWLNGDLAVMRAYDYALSDGEVAELSAVFGDQYGITVSRPDNDMPKQTYSQLFSVPGNYTWQAPSGVGNVSILTVGAGGGGSHNGNTTPGGDTYVYTPWNGYSTNMNTNAGYTTAPFITFDCSTGNNAVILGNVAPGWLVIGNDFNTTDSTSANRALIQGNVYGIVTSIDSSNVSNVVIGVYPNVSSNTNGTYNFLGNTIVGAQGAFEASSTYRNQTEGPGPRTMAINADGYGSGGVQDYFDNDALGGGGAGGYGNTETVVAYDPNQTFIYDNTGDSYTGVANVVLALSNNNLTVAGTANNYSGTEGIATGTYSFLGSQVMFSLTVDVVGATNYQGVGFGNYNANIVSYIGGDTNSVGFYNGGDFYFDDTASYSGYPSFLGVNNIVDIAIDDINHLTWVRVNGGDWMGDPAANPSTGANGVPYTLTGPLYLMVTAGDANDLGQLSINASNTYPIPSGYSFVAGLANAGSTGGDGAGYQLPTNKAGQGDGTTIGGSGGGGGGIVYNTGSGGGGTGLYGIGNPGVRGGWVNKTEYPGVGARDNTIFATGAGGGSTAGNSGTVGGIASNWAGGAGGWPGGGGGSGTDFWGAGNGGALAYKNNVTVTPGQSIGIIVGQGGYGGGVNNDDYISAGVGAGGAVRIIWPGLNRQFPNTNVGIESGPTSLTINSGDLTIGSSISFPNGTIGNSYTQTQPANSTVAQNLFAFFRTIGAYTQNSLNYVGSPNNPNFFNSYIFNVTWSAGSPVTNGLVRMGYNASDGTLYMTSVDPSNADYQIANPASVDPGGATLPGTYNFPATFTLYSPTTESGGNYWC